VYAAVLSIHDAAPALDTGTDIVAGKTLRVF
jgi:hypothetical protein